MRTYHDDKPYTEEEVSLYDYDLTIDAGVLTAALELAKCLEHAARKYLERKPKEPKR